MSHWGRIVLGGVLLIAALVPPWGMGTQTVQAQPIQVPEVNAQATVCSRTLQSYIVEALPNTTVTIPACVYRESVVIGKPGITLQAQPGAEIRGSDIWADWVQEGSYWKRAGLPYFSSGVTAAKCIAPRCEWPAQVFVNGQPLVQAMQTTQRAQITAAPGQFAVLYTCATPGTACGTVYLADDPRGKTVEVSTRTTWITPRAGSNANNITIQGFTMQHAANPAQHFAALRNHVVDGTGRRETYEGWNIVGNKLFHAHGAIASFTNKTGRLVGNEIAYGGQLGVHTSFANVYIANNNIHHNNTERFVFSFEAGGLKSVGTPPSVWENNIFAWNEGRGAWCDLGCDGVQVRNNQIHNNLGPQFHYELSNNGLISGNKVWSTRPQPDREIHPAIRISGASNTVIENNVVAFSPDGIYIQSACRAAPPNDPCDPNVAVNRMQNNDVHDNSLIGINRFALGWIEEDIEFLYYPSANNRGANNRYWPQDESVVHFSWRSPFRRLSGFNATPGEHNGRYLTKAEMCSTLAQAGIPNTICP